MPPPVQVPPSGSEANSTCTPKAARAAR